MYCANTQKAELLEICRTQGIRKVSRLTKNELAAKITAHLTVGVAEKMVCWDQPTYDLMDHIVSEKDPYYPLDPDSPADVEAYFLEENIGFAIRVNQEGYWAGALLVPKEIQQVFEMIDDAAFQERVKFNTKLIRLAKGLLHYYGTLTPEEMAHFLNHLLDQPLDALEIAAIVAETGPFNWEIHWDGERFSDSRLLKLQYVLSEREKYRELEFRKLTYEQVWRAGEPGFRQPTAEMQDLEDFILSGKPKEGKEELIESLFGLFQSDLPPTEILPGIAQFLELGSEREVTKLAHMLFNCYNNTPLWVLKGHTPADLSRQVLSDSGASSSRKKVGRNDPCPCGSGRKFKRCCGRS
jgi:hypothetical protein